MLEIKSNAFFFFGWNVNGIFFPPLMSKYYWSSATRQHQTKEQEGWCSNTNNLKLSYYSNHKTVKLTKTCTNWNHQFWGTITWKLRYRKPTVKTGFILVHGPFFYTWEEDSGGFRNFFSRCFSTSIICLFFINYNLLYCCFINYKIINCCLA